MGKLFILMTSETFINKKEKDRCSRGLIPVHLSFFLLIDFMIYDNHFGGVSLDQ